MKLHFHGAAADVTGAAFQLTTRDASVLVDCGLYQGSRQTVAKNRNIPTLARRHLDAVVVSHAHLDHIGRLPFHEARLHRPDLRHPADLRPGTGDHA
jgi:metallo-beta-lactamase family protein